MFGTHCLWRWCQNGPKEDWSHHGVAHSKVSQGGSKFCEPLFLLSPICVWVCKHCSSFTSCCRVRQGIPVDWGMWWGIQNTQRCSNFSSHFGISCRWWHFYLGYRCQWWRSRRGVITNTAWGRKGDRVLQSGPHLARATVLCDAQRTPGDCCFSEAFPPLSIWAALQDSHWPWVFEVATELQESGRTVVALDAGHEQLWFRDTVSPWQTA